jgi:hypothetical protein
VGENGDTVSQVVNILLTGTPATSSLLLNVPSDTVVVTDGRDTTVNFKIVDTLGNPISAGNAVSVSLDGDVTNELLVSGDNNFTTDANITNFSL